MIRYRMAHLEELIEELATQETRITFSRFTPDLGVEIGLALYETARDQGAPVAIDVYAFDHVLFHLALPGASTG